MSSKSFSYNDFLPTHERRLTLVGYGCVISVLNRKQKNIFESVPFNRDGISLREGAENS